ncbi:hypothetical protein LZC07_09795, partial [Campylobacter coli]
IRLTAQQGIQIGGNLLAGSDINSSLVGSADLLLSSQGDIRASGSLLSNKAIAMTGRRVDLSQGALAADQVQINAQDSGIALQRTR